MSNEIQTWQLIVKEKTQNGTAEAFVSDRSFGLALVLITEAQDLIGVGSHGQLQMQIAGRLRAALALVMGGRP